ncbi:TIGR04222 domain-containing membrane protein [Croceicoccus bisphenolivorans]|uniref:TIGR04222 domain-containing membrane protein n=1 Tax=Croceicoccus bisphenolivorans TaxID=1783232 RepID=UPI0008351F6B|nr:TIGR04222 domain-containing membrane protein [Croceicoccus bisphenolivorans]
MHGLNPLDWDATEFLILYGVLIVAAIVLRGVIANWLRPEGERATLRDEEEIAILAGGPNRFAEAVTARMLASGMLTMPAKGQFAVAQRGGHATPAERAVIAAGTRSRWSGLRRVLKGHAAQVEQRLADRGIYMDSAEALQVRFLTIVPFLFLLGFGWIRWKVGVAREEDVGFLIVMMAIAAILMLASLGKLDRATRSAKSELASLRATKDRLRRAPRAEETGMAVALYGTTVLAGTSLAGFHTLRSDSGSGGCGSSDGGGCGGGGCGGCGG